MIVLAVWPQLYRTIVSILFVLTEVASLRESIIVWSDCGLGVECFLFFGWNADRPLRIQADWGTHFHREFSDNFAVVLNFFYRRIGLLWLLWLLVVVGIIAHLLVEWWLELLLLEWLLLESLVLSKLLLLKNIQLLLLVLHIVVTWI